MTAAGQVATTTGLLDVVEAVLRAACHPDIVQVERYGPGLGPWGPTVDESPVLAVTGVRVTHRSTATASLWEAIWPGEAPVPPPAGMPPARRGPRLLVFVNQLLDLAKPPQLQAWRLVALPNLGVREEAGVVPVGLSAITADGGRMLLRATSTGPTSGSEPTEEPSPRYVIPQDAVKDACREIG